MTKTLEMYAVVCTIGGVRHACAAASVNMPDGIGGLVDSFPMLDEVREALHDAIRRPMGVVPASAEPFYSVAEAEAAEARRIALKENPDGL